MFYDLCDELGILLWHDFPFANTMYPGDTESIDNIIAETRDNMRRLRNHPSIGFWCGNNEIKLGWNAWGWSGMN